ncbi:MAG TPA: class I SAM-dependent DNA methyltransferase [Candidatus Omnitrophota bacterium]|nr:class I SAM-dependent DNA methyltransferase [Candidatus Omnitrophota bacterium]HNX82469.1 class I SAM-dependent DNA methyltransferase [Candidatus Omnitrophota bacterium]HPT06970.1 class I SAM-dependent DNA methyltransferase [Candidatus Omnitrophota bacterium]
MSENEIIQKVWNYCDVLRDDGVSYGDYVEQLTYLLFLKMSDERDELYHDSEIPAKYNWKSLKKLEGEPLEGHYITIMRELGKQKGIIGRIFLKSMNKIQDPAKLKRLINMIDDEKWLGLDIDIKGTIYEGLLEKNAQDTKGGAGQYFTPRALIKAMVEVMKPQPGMKICDPACGTGGFLLNAFDYVFKKFPTLSQGDKKFMVNEALYGVDIVESVARLCAMNMYLHGIGLKRSPVEVADALASKGSEHFDMVLTNPPFGKKSSTTIIGENGKAGKEKDTYERDDFWTTTSNKQLNFVQHIASILKVQGKAAVVVPDNVLFEGGAGETVRKKLLHDFDLHTILRLPTGIFYAQGVKANVIFFDKKPAQEKPWTSKVWIYDLRTNKHFTLKENTLAPDDLTDFVKCYNADNRAKRKESERFKVFAYEEILKRDKVSLDIFWLKDESLEDLENLPDPDVIAGDIVKDLESALEEFKGVVEELGKGS